MSLRAGFVLNMVEFAELQGKNNNSLVDALEKIWEYHSGEEVYVERNIIDQLMNSITAFNGDHHFGLHFGEYSGLMAAKLTLPILRSSITIKEALISQIDYIQQEIPIIPIEAKELDKTFEIILHPDPKWFNSSTENVAHLINCSVLFLLIGYKMLTLNKSAPIRVHFGYPKPLHLKEYQRLFNLPIYFDKEQTAIFLDRQSVESQLELKNYYLLQALVHYTSLKLELLQKNDENIFANRIKQIALNIITPKFPSIDQIAQNANYSKRTLQRRLKEDGYTYKTLLDELRRDLALNYLKNPELNIHDISNLLEYSEPSSFIRTFKRWEQMTPSDYRQIN